jgi:hypothetical protein
MDETKTHLMFSDVSDNRAVYEIMWKNTADGCRPLMAIWRMRTACWIPKGTNTNSEYAILIAFSTTIMFARKRLLLGYTYISCFVSYNEVVGSSVCRV